MISRRTAALDLLLVVAASLAVYSLELLAQTRGLFPLPELFRGVATVLAGFAVAWLLLRRHGQRPSEVGLGATGPIGRLLLRALLVFVVNVVGQLTVVPLLAQALGLPPTDWSRYEPLHGNLGLLLVTIPGVMLTGGFMEEFLYRGLIMHRLATLLGGDGRPGVRAALLSGLIFGLVHFEWGWGGIALTSVMGAILGLMFLVCRRSLWPLILAHATMDLILVTQVYFNGAG